MKRVHVLVEGQTEEAFVQRLLGPHLLSRSIQTTPIIVATKRTKSGSKFKGGITKYSHVKRDLRRLLNDKSAAAVTTMLDFYGLPRGFPGVAALPERESCYRKVEHLESALAADLRDPRLIPYLSLHEFEALLLVSPKNLLSAFRTRQSRRRVAASLLGSASSPEEVNDGKDTHPAARILRLLPGYRKNFHGPLIAGRIGLASIRQQCPHFDAWVTKLETLAASPAR